MENIVDVVSNLSLTQKVMLNRKLEEMIKEESVKEIEMRCEDKSNIVLKALELLGLTEYKAESRLRGQVLCRVILANLFFSLGMIEERVGEILEKSHSTIHYYKDVFRSWSACPHMYEKELSIWTQLKDYYHETH